MNKKSNLLVLFVLLLTLQGEFVYVYSQTAIPQRLTSGAGKPSVTILIPASSAIPDPGRQLTKTRFTAPKLIDVFNTKFSGTTGPDLVISGQSTDPTSGSPGSVISMFCRLTNQGSLTAGPSTLRVFLSTNQTYNASDIGLGYAELESITPGGYYTITGDNIPIPSEATYGSYYILFIADADGTVSETNENNNLSFSNFTITSTFTFNPPRNLAAGVTGSNVTLTWSTPLSGSSGTLSSYKVYRNGSVITTISNPAQLTYTNSGLPVGTYSYYVTATYTSVNGESAASNQVSATISTTNLPDLVITNPAVTPNSIFPGEKIDLSCRLANQGTASAGTSVIQVFLSANITYESTDVLLADGTLDPISAGSYLEVGGKGITIPSSTKPGTYYVIYVADATALVLESNENNNNGYVEFTVKSSVVMNPPRNLSAVVSGNNAQLTWVAPIGGSSGTVSGYKIYRNGVVITTITNPSTLTYPDQGLSVRTYQYYVTATFVNPVGESGPSNQISVVITTINLPDLIVTRQSISPTTQYPGGHVNLSFRTQNQGNGNAGSSMARIYLSHDHLLNNEDIQIAYGELDPIDAGSFIDMTGEEITIPDATIPGEYFILFIADADGVVLESSETNNVSFSHITITIKQTFNPPTNLQSNVSGRTVTLSWNLPAGGSSGTLSGYKVYQNGVSVRTITGNNTECTISGLEPGTYKFYITATYKSVDGESIGSNQVSATISPIVGPDLIITNPSITPAAIIPGRTIDFSCLLMNQGTSIAGNSVIAVYLSANQTLETGDVYLTSGNMVAINAGESYTVTGKNITISRFNRPGNYFILFVADADVEVAEFYEDNNITSIPILLTITAGIDDMLTIDNLTLFPVPTSDFLSINYSGTYHGKCHVTILNITGSTLYSEEIFLHEGLKLSLNVQEWLNGYYYVKFETGQETFTRQMIILH